MVDTFDMVVFWAVVIARFLLPLTIPKYPLPGVLACLILEGVDQTIFQQFKVYFSTAIKAMIRLLISTT